MKVLLYCTKGKPYLYHFESEKRQWNNGLYKPFDYRKGFAIYDKLQKNHVFREGDLYVALVSLLNGKIVAECEVNDIEVFTTDYRRDPFQLGRICLESCLSINDLINYQGDNQFLYALYLSNVNIFDDPKDLDYYHVKRFGCFTTELSAPQNMCYCFDEKDNKYIVISIQPQHLVKILNGEKPIEVRKQIVNELKELI